MSGGGERGSGGGGVVFLKKEGVSISICRGWQMLQKGWVKFFSPNLLFNVINKVNTI